MAVVAAFVATPRYPSTVFTSKPIFRAICAGVCPAIFSDLARAVPVSSTVSCFGGSVSGFEAAGVVAASGVEGVKPAVVVVAEGVDALPEIPFVTIAVLLLCGFAHETRLPGMGARSAS